MPLPDLYSNIKCHACPHPALIFFKKGSGEIVGGCAQHRDRVERLTRQRNRIVEAVMITKNAAHSLHLARERSGLNRHAQRPAWKGTRR